MFNVKLKLGLISLQLDFFKGRLSRDWVLLLTSNWAELIAASLGSRFGFNLN